MPRISIENLGKVLDVELAPRPLLFQLQNHSIDWMHACGGKGRCTTCKAIILNGSENLGPRTLAEQRYIDKHMLRNDERLACQVTVLGDIVIKVPDESKLPHLKYLD